MLQPDTADQIQARAWGMYQAGKRQEAAQLCAAALQQVPLHAASLQLLGILALEDGRLSEAIRYLHHASLLQPDDARVHQALGEAFRMRGDFEHASPCFREAVRLQPDMVAPHHSLGVVFMDQRMWPEAAQAFRKTIQLEPGHERAHLNLGRVLQETEDLQGAKACFLEAVRLKPDYPIALNNLGVLLHMENRYDEAETNFRRALRQAPDYPEAHFNLGNALLSLGKSDEAAQYFQQAVRHRPNYVKAHFNLGLALAELGRKQDAYHVFRNVLALDPAYADAHVQIGHLLHQDQHFELAEQEYTKALAIQSDLTEAIVSVCRIHELVCDWRNRDQDLARLQEITEKALNDNDVSPVGAFHAVTLPWPMEQVVRVCRSHALSSEKKLAATRQALNFTHPRKRSGKLRIGYLSADFHDHPTSHLIQSLFGLHDRQNFEIYIYSYGKDDGSSYRQRIVKECDHFRDLAVMSLTDCARQIHADGIHILMDLKGYTQNTRLQILALRPAPIQCHYLGFPGPIAASFVDYGFTDPVVTPPEIANLIPEKLVLLPHSYFVTDDEQSIADIPVTRQEYRLPDKGFVYCCFNQNYKIAPDMFDVWMRILAQVPDSVLWLYSASETGEKHLHREAKARQINPERLVFAKRKPKTEHLARLRLADLFLDTYHVNAHTTAIDALWTGLPLITCKGQTWCSRVGASLLSAVGLSECITETFEAYERLAVKLGTDADKARQLRAKLAENRNSTPLFNTAQFARSLEQGYQQIWQNHEAGQPPKTFTITA